MSSRIHCTKSRIRCMRFRFLNIVACTIFRHDRLRSKWSQCNSLVRKSCNVVCTYKSKAWFLKVVIVAVFACVLLNMSRVIFQHFSIIASPLVYIPCILSIDSLCQTHFDHGCCCTNTSLSSAELIYTHVHVCIYHKYVCIAQWSL